MRAVLRLFAIAFGYLIAVGVTTAAVTVLFAFMGEGDRLVEGLSALVFFASMLPVFGAFALKAWLPVIVIAEWQSWRNWLVYVALAMIVGVIGAFLGPDGLIDAAPLAASAALGGLTYWLIAGRNAGRWQKDRAV
ncbi:hypothetical protein [Notoacmeibacter sp. MSK16QG-6]|uniref:hypothetical protein n=1 Tax=Notoacmeibacter sp. MSK16QG-6 TaxID=2957982 RepID=UPI00209CDBE9|nr:hypothetical protein [Notoacmeibacter sp. MSK16QG-6]MCP1199156.1 hypothetical protein [Notoacmeibacter sp. MSK16QG-6]